MAVTCSVKDNFVSNTTQKVLEWIDLLYRSTTNDNGTYDSSITTEDGNIEMQKVGTAPTGETYH